MKALLKTIILAPFLLTGISYGQDSTQLSQITLLGIPAGGSIPKVRTLVQTEWNGGNYYGWEFVSNANDEYIAFTWFHGAPAIAGRSNIDISEHNFEIRSDLVLRTYVEYPEPTVAIVYAYAGTSEETLIEIGNIEVHDGVGVIAKDGYPADPSVPFWPYGGGRYPGMLFHENSGGTTERPLFKLFKDGYLFGSDEADMYVGTFNTPLATYDAQYRDARDGYYVSHLLLEGDGTVKMDGNYNGGFSYYREAITVGLTVPILNGWNLVSVPGLHPIDQNVNTWWAFRDPAANVFKFAGGYEPVTTADPGKGYWMKHTGDRTYNTGDEWPAGGIQIVAHNPLTGATGWNLIGGYEIIATASFVTTNPPGLQSGPIYKYSGGYQVATTIDPGYGYWIKLTGAGQIIIAETLAKGEEPKEWFPENWGKIVLTDASGISYILYAVNGEVDLSQYELPPAPMEGMYDLRFSSGRVAEDINSAMQTIEMQGVTYPLTVRAEGMDMRLRDETGKTVNVNLKSGEDVVISDATIQKLMVTSELLPTVYSLEQNYPNPFNPSTMIEFSLPEDVNNVKLSIYNALGEKVAELVNAALTAGRFQYQWNSKNATTGIYIYELRAEKFVSVKKMILLK